VLFADIEPPSLLIRIITRLASGTSWPRRLTTSSATPLISGRVPSQSS
jgi:hypothetical protein